MAEGVEVVSELTSRYKVVGDVMTFQIHMETDAQPFIEHLTATLTRSRD